MTPNEQAAYRKGQEDMRNRIAASWHGWFIDGFGFAVACTAVRPVKHRNDRKSIQAARVDLKIRRVAIRECAA